MIEDWVAFSTQELLGEEEYNKVLDKVNADLPEAQKVHTSKVYAQGICFRLYYILLRIYNTYYIYIFSVNNNLGKPALPCGRPSCSIDCRQGREGKVTRERLLFLFIASSQSSDF